MGSSHDSPEEFEVHEVLKEDQGVRHSKLQTGQWRKAGRLCKAKR